MAQTDLEGDLVVVSEVKGHVTHSQWSPKCSKWSDLRGLWSCFHHFYAKSTALKHIRPPGHRFFMKIAFLHGDRSCCNMVVTRKVLSYRVLRPNSQFSPFLLHFCEDCQAPIITFLDFFHKLQIQQASFDQFCIENTIFYFFIAKNHRI